MNNINYDFSGNIVFITGASRGIGGETAKLYARAKADLILTEIEENFSKLLIYSKELEDTYGIEVHNYILDIRNLSEIKHVVDQAVANTKKINILINNAGINRLTRAIQITEDEWDDILDINLKGTFFMTQEIGKHMIVYNGGSIISVSSQHGVVGNEMRAHYCSSKAGLINMTKALAYEWAPYGIRINTVAPTFVLNDCNQELLNQKDMIKKGLNRIPLKKYAKSEDIAHAIAFLSSQEAHMITGFNLLVDGGWTAI